MVRRGRVWGQVIDSQGRIACGDFLGAIIAKPVDEVYKISSQVSAGTGFKPDNFDL